jgi:predicted Zn-dependent peptidase
MEKLFMRTYVMKRRENLLVLLLMAMGLSLASACWAGYERVAEAATDDPMRVSIFRLDNGLTVFITENHETPRFYAEMGVRAGSKNDPPETTGLAHYFEHLMFKGSTQMGTLDYAKEQPELDRIAELYEQHRQEKDPDKRQAIYAEIDRAAQQAAQYAVPNELDQVYKVMGGENINAHTWLEETVYEVELPANRIEQWAAIESDRFAAPVFRLFPTELETVYEEKNRSLDNKDQILYTAVGKLLFKRHPYGQQTTLGEPEHLKNPSIRNIETFFKEWYVPENMALSISGDLDAERTIKIVDEHFSALPRKAPPAQKSWEEEPLEGREAVTVQYTGEEQVLLAFRTAPLGDADADALLLVDMILDNANAGLINLNLNQAQKVRQAGSFPTPMNDYGVEYLYGVPKEGQTLEEVERLLLEQLGILKRGEFEDWVLPAIINDFKKQEKTSLESNAGRVSMLTRAFIAYEPWEHAVGRIARLEKITKDDVVRIANKYFQGNFVAGYRLDKPHEVVHVAKPELTKVDIDPTRQSKFAAQILALPCPPIEPVFIDPSKDYHFAEDPNGVTFYHTSNPINDVFSMSVSVDFGSIEDNTIAAAVLLLEKSGTEKFSPADLKKEWYKLGTEFGIKASDNETVVALTGLDENFDASVALLMDLMMHPKVDEETLAQLKQIILVKRADAKKDPDSVASALVQYHRLGPESSFLRLLPEEQLKAITMEQLQRVTRGLLGYRHTVSYTGTLPLDTVKAVFAKYHPIEKPLADPPPYRYLKARQPEQSEIYFFDKEMAQARVRIEFGSVDYDPALEPAIQLYNSYFAGGMAGIVFQELREARGLAYIAGARYLTGYRAKDQNLMLGVIQNQPDKTVEAVQAFIELMDHLPSSPERFAIARESLINLYRTGKVGFREVLGAVRGWKRQGLDPDPRPGWFQAVQNSSLDTVLEFHRQHLADKPKLISIVGQQSNIDMEGLKATASIRPVTLDEIFVK